MSEKIVAGFCQDNCKFEVYTKEEIVGLLEYVIEHNALPEDIISGGTISTNLAAVNSIIEQNKGRALKIWVGTQAEFDAYTGDWTDVYAIISDDPTLQQLLSKVENFENHILSLDKTVENIIDGTTPVSILKSDGTMAGLTQDENGVLKTEGEIISKKKLIFSSDEGVSSFVYETHPNTTYQIQYGAWVVNLVTNDSGNSAYQNVHWIDPTNSGELVALITYISIDNGEFLIHANDLNLSTKEYVSGTSMKIKKVYEIIE